MSSIKDKNEQNSKIVSQSNDKENEEQKSEVSLDPINIDPEEAKFAHSGGKSEHMIVNFTPKRMAIKARCGSAYYRIEPTHTIVEPNKCRQMNIIRLTGPIGTDKVIVQYVECGDKIDAKAAFKNAEAEGKKIASIKIKLIAAANGGRKLSREVVEE